MRSEPVNGSGVFKPEAVVAINQAYEEAIEILQIKHAHSDRRAAVAKYIMDAAKDGEIEASRLCDGAVAAQRRTDRIAERAHEIWQSEGRPEGRQNEHWRRAEQEFDAKDDNPDRSI